MSSETLALPKEKSLENKPTKNQAAPSSKSAKSLKGGWFIVGNTSPHNIFTAEEWSEEQQMIAQTVIDFCIKHVQTPFFERGRELEVSREEDKQEVVEMMRQAGELGLCGVSIPETYGGLGLDFNTGVLFSEAIAAGFSFATTLGAQTSIGSLPIVYYGNETQKQKYLPGVASGQLIAAYALTEPTAGSDANAGKTKAILTPDGSHYLLNGQKIWITNGGIADIFVVFAKIDTDRDLSAFIVERNYEGLSIGSEEKKMGIKGSSTVQLFFDNCKVPVENLLGEREGGFKMALNILNTGRIKLGAGGVGAGKFTITRCVEFTTERHQFGQPISDFGAIKHKLGTIATQTHALEAALYRTGHNIDTKATEFKAQGLSDSDASLKAVREFAVECSILKTKGSVLACFATDEGMQMHGGMGYATEMGMEMAYRDARITKIYEGTNEVNRMLSVGELTKRGLQTKELDLVGAGKKVPGFILSQMMPFKSNSKFSAEKRLVQGLKNTFLLISGAAGKKLRKKLIDEQEIILNFSDILAEAYVCESILLRIQKLQATQTVDPKKLQLQTAMMQLYLYEARDIAKKAAKDAINSFASGFERKALLYSVRKMLEPIVVNPKQIRREVADYLIKNKGYCF